MTKNKQESVRIDSEILDKLRQIKDERGLPLAEQLRRGMSAWILKIETPNDFTPPRYDELYFEEMDKLNDE